MMSGADELEALSHELDELSNRDAVQTGEAANLSEVEHQLAESLEDGEEIFHHVEDPGGDEDK